MARRRGVLATLVQMQREAERDRERRARAVARAQRDAERATAARRCGAVQDQKLRDRLYAEDRTREAADDTAQLERQVEVLQGVLAATLGVDDYLDLEALKQASPSPVFDPLVVGAPPSPPQEEDFAVEAPSALGRVFAASKHAARAGQRQAEYQEALDDHTVAAQRHAERLEEARRRHEADVARQAEEHRRHVEEVTALQRDLAARRPDAVVRYLDLVLEAAEYPDGFPHSWRLAYASASGHLAIEYELPSVDVVPANKACKYVKSSDTITPSARPAAQVRGLYTAVLRQTALRVVHEVLEADRGGAVRTVVLNGYVHGNDPATGREVHPCLVALATSRERFLELDLARVDIAACLAHLEARLSKDPSKLQAVEPIVLAGSLEADYTLETDPEPGSSLADVALDDVPSATRTTEQQELVAGQNVPLAGTRVQVDLLISDADLSVLLVGASGRVDRDEDFVFYNNPRSEDGAVTLTGNGASIDTIRLPQRHEGVVLVVSRGEGPVAEATGVLRQPGGDADFRFSPADSARVSALVWGELYRRNGAGGCVRSDKAGPTGSRAWPGTTASTSTSACRPTTASGPKRAGVVIARARLGATSREPARRHEWTSGMTACCDVRLSTVDRQAAPEREAFGVPAREERHGTPPATSRRRPSSRHRGVRSRGRARAAVASRDARVLAPAGPRGSSGACPRPTIGHHVTSRVHRIDANAGALGGRLCRRRERRARRPRCR